MIVCDTPDEIRFFSLLSMRGRLKLEMKGLRFKPVRGMSTATVVKKMFKLPKNCRNEKASDGPDYWSMPYDILKELTSSNTQLALRMKDIATAWETTP